MYIICDNCGYKNREEAGYCYGCGCQLPHEVNADQESVSKTDMIEKLTEFKSAVSDKIYDNSIKKASNRRKHGAFIRWIKNNFETSIGLMFVISVIFWICLGLLFGNMFEGSQYYTLLGGILGFLFGFMINVMLFGYFATVLNIAETNDEILDILLQSTEKD